jgi:anti-sigma factor ChrR (cupin superfamily)
LFLDEARGRRTTLVRLAPGSVYPAHRHRDIEEIYLLDGELTISGVAMQPGDYCRAEPDSVHEDTYSEHGCTFIVTASVHDQLVG